MLEPLLSAFRAAASTGPGVTIIHVPNGHALDGACAPLAGPGNGAGGSEVVVNTTAQFDAVLRANNISTVFYAGYAANTDMLFGVGGMARYYSQHRYLQIPAPDYYWVQDATIAVETPESLGGRWAKKAGPYESYDRCALLVDTTTFSLQHRNLIRVVTRTVYARGFKTCD